MRSIMGIKVITAAVILGATQLPVTAALTRITVSAVNGVGMTSRAYDGSSQVGYSGWAGSWTATIKNPQPAGYYVPPAPYSPGFTFTAFCTDIGNTMGNGTYDYEALSFSSASLTSPEGVPPDPNWANALSGQRAAWIYNTLVGQVNASGTITINSASTTQNQRRSAMCIAIWEALYEGSGYFDVMNRGNTGSSDDNTGRTFVVTGDTGTLNLANYWLGLGVAAGFAGYDYTWFAERTSPDPQSLVGPWAPIPEPTTVIAGALLLLPFLASTFRRSRKI